MYASIVVSMSWTLAAAPPTWDRSEVSPLVRVGVTRVLCRRSTAVQEGVLENHHHHGLLFAVLRILTAYPLGVVVDILDTQWGEHHADGLSRHAHLCADGETQPVKHQQAITETLGAGRAANLT